MAGHNPSGRGRSYLTLSEVKQGSRNVTRLAPGCRHALPAGARADSRYCSPACRQAAYRRRIDPQLTPRGARRSPAVDNRVDAGPTIEAGTPGTGHPPRVEQRAATPSVVSIPGHVHSPSARLCVECVTSRHAQLQPAPRARVSAELVAHVIRHTPHGSVHVAARRFGISTRHAERIRAGWRGAGRLADPIPHRSTGWVDGYHTGHDPETRAYMTGEAQLAYRHPSADVRARAPLAEPPPIVVLPGPDPWADELDAGERAWGLIVADLNRDALASRRPA